MIKDYFITNNLFYIIQVRISKKYLIFKLKGNIKIPKYYYSYLLKNLYNIFPCSINTKIYNKYYKLITIKYLI